MGIQLRYRERRLAKSFQSVDYAPCERPGAYAVGFGFFGGSGEQLFDAFMTRPSPSAGSETAVKYENHVVRDVVFQLKLVGVPWDFGSVEASVRVFSSMT
jgi:hypothetical protein